MEIGIYLINSMELFNFIFNFYFTNISFKLGTLLIIQNYLLGKNAAIFIIAFLSSIPTKIYCSLMVEEITPYIIYIMFVIIIRKLIKLLQCLYLKIIINIYTIILLVQI
jgi:hypothetical protein